MSMEHLEYSMCVTRFSGIIQGNQPYSTGNYTGTATAVPFFSFFRFSCSLQDLLPKEQTNVIDLVSMLTKGQVKRINKVGGSCNLLRNSSGSLTNRFIPEQRFSRFSAERLPVPELRCLLSYSRVLPVDPSPSPALHT